MKARFDSFLSELRRNRTLFLMVLPAMLIVFVFSYLPMSGLVLAFKDYRFNLGVFKSPWNGFQNFRFLFASGTGWLITKNTIFYNLLNLLTSQALAIIIAICLSEMVRIRWKKAFQSMIFFPYFISWVIVGTFVYNIFNYETGLMNTILTACGVDPVNVYSMPGVWPVIICLFNSWKWCGYNSVVYIAAITGLDVECYEAAKIDGANIFQRIRYITLPGIRPTIITMLLLNVGRILRGDFEMFFQIVGNNGQLFNATDVIDTYVFRSLTTSGNMGMTAAATLYQSVLCFVIIMVVNGVIRKIDPDNALF